MTRDDDDDNNDYNVIIIRLTHYPRLKVDPTCKTLYHTLDVSGHWTLSVKNQTFPKIFTQACSNNKHDSTNSQRATS